MAEFSLSDFIPTAGTELYVILPPEDSPAGSPGDCDDVVSLGCVTSLDLQPDSIEERFISCIPSKTRIRRPGQITPGVANVTLKLSSCPTTEKRLFDLAKDQTVLKWAIGFSQSETPPTAELDSATNECEFVTTDDRDWLLFEGATSFSVGFPVDDDVEATMAIQAGEKEWVLRTECLAA